MRVTLDDNSPSLQYVSLNASKPWTHDILEATLGDSRLSRYFRGTMTRTTGEGDFMALTFNGTAVAIYGAKRYNHGVYSVSLDGSQPWLQSGGEDKEEFQALLFKQADLDESKEHTVVITNLPSKSPALPPNEAWYLDIDYVNIISGSHGDDVYTTRIDDTSTECAYQGDWIGGPSAYQEMYYNTTAHFTSALNDAVTCKFNGTSVQILGGIYPEHGNYSVSIDGTDAIALNGTFYAFDGQVPLYTVTSLVEGPHTITMVNLEDGKMIDFDYLIVNSTIEPGSGSPPRSNVTEPSDDAANADPKDAPAPIGAIIGGSLGGLLLVVILFFLAWFLRRRQNNMKAKIYAEKPSLYLTGDEVWPFHDSSTPPTNRSFGELPSATSASAQSPIGSRPDLSIVPTSPLSSNASHPALVLDQSREQHDSFQGLDNQAYPPSTSVTPRTSLRVASDAELSGNSRQPALARDTKAASIALSSTRPQPVTLASSDGETLGQTPSTRLYVNGRESDAGPAFLSPLSEESSEMGILPPDYHQATEPLFGQMSRPGV